MPALLVFRAGELLLPLALAYWFGRSSAMDVYQFALSVFTFAGSLLFAAFRDSALIPVLAEERLARPHLIPKLLGSVVTYTWACGGVLALLIAALAAGWFCHKYDGVHLQLALWTIVPFSLSLLVVATRSFFGAVLSVERHFVIQPIASGVGMVFTLAAVALPVARDRWGVLVVPVASLIGETVSLAIHAWFTLLVARIRVSLSWDRPAPVVRVARLIAHEVGGGAVTRINPVIDQLMAGLSGVIGAGTMLRLSSDVALVPTSILQAALLPVLLSHLADQCARREYALAERTILRTIAVVSALLVAATSIMWALRAPLLRVAYLRGAMDAAGVDRMIHVMPYHLIGLAPFGLLLVLSRAHVALGNSAIMTKMGILNAGLNIVFNVILVKTLSIEGLALSTSCVHLAITIVFAVLLRRRLIALRALSPLVTAAATTTPARVSPVTGP